MLAGARAFRACSTSIVDAVPADHSSGHVVGDVAVIEPVAGVVLGVLHRERGRRPQDLRVGEAPRRVEPAVPVQMEDVELLAERGDAPADAVPDLGFECRRVAEVRGAVDAVLACRACLPAVRRLG